MFIVLPIILHINADIISIGFILFLLMKIIIRGISFCRVMANQNVIFLETKKHIGINHLWKGAAPSFSSRVRINNNIGADLFVAVISFLTILNSKKIELRAWIKK